MTIPEAVLKAAKGLVNLYGPNLVLLGERAGQEVYQFVFPKDEKTGFPFVYLYEKGKPVLELTDYEALDIVASFAE